MSHTKRWLVSALCLAAVQFAAPAGAQAPSYPERPARIIIPFGPGGPTDTIGRLVADELSKTFGQPFVVENVPGAAGTIGIGRVARAKPDGYTLGISGVGPAAITPFLDAQAPYDPVKDLDFIGLLNVSDALLVMRRDFKPKTVDEIFAYAKANPDQLKYSSVGVASPNHVAFEEMARRAGVTVLHVPYTGEAQATTALLSAEVDVSLITVASAGGHVASGNLVAVAAAGDRRLPAYASVPTLAEQTDVLADFAYLPWSVLVAPKGIPTEIADALNAAVNRALASPEIKTRMEKFGMSPLGGDTESARGFILAEIDRYTAMLKDNAIKRE